MKILEGVLDRGDTVASENAIGIQNIWLIAMIYVAFEG